jgi:5-methylcytosine-specific restriction endonuclease McrA
MLFIPRQIQITQRRGRFCSHACHGAFVQGLNAQRNKRVGFSAHFRESIFIRDRWVCGICRKHVKRLDASIDHLVPVSRGGTNDAANLRLAHLRCNVRRHNRGPAQLLLFA